MCFVPRDLETWLRACLALTTKLVFGNFVGKLPVFPSCFEASPDSHDQQKLIYLRKLQVNNITNTWLFSALKNMRPFSNKLHT